MKSDSGFTLIEVLVAVTLLGVIATLVASGARLALDVGARTTAGVDAVRTEAVGRMLVRAQLQGALPLAYRTRENEKTIQRVAFEGNDDRMRFVSRTGLFDGPASLPRWIDFHEETQDGKGMLVVEERRILPPDNLPDEKSPIARSEILECTGLRLEYLDTTGEKPQWRASWNELVRPSPLPFAVRIRCGMSGDSMKLVIPLDYAESARQGMALQ